MSPKTAKAPAKPRKVKDPNAPKRPVGRPRKDGSLPRLKKDGRASGSSSDSDSDDLEIEEIPEPKPAILNSAPPTDLEGKAVFDTAQAVWSPRNKSGVPDQIRAGIAHFGETVQKLRNVWKTKNVALQQAENANSTAVPTIKEEVARYRRLMELVTKQAVVLGHPAHLTKYVCSLFLLLLTWLCHAGNKLFLAEFAKSQVHVEMKLPTILHNRIECHNKGLAFTLDCRKAKCNLVLPGQQPLPLLAAAQPDQYHPFRTAKGVRSTSRSCYCFFQH